MNGFNSAFGQQRQPQRRVKQGRRQVSDENVLLWIGLGLLYFFHMPVAILLFVGMYYFGKIQISFKWERILMPTLACLALSTFFYPQTYMTLRVATFVLFILYLCGRFKFRMR